VAGLKEYEWNETVTKQDKLVGRLRKIAQVKREERLEKKRAEEEERRSIREEKRKEREAAMA